MFKYLVGGLLGMVLLGLVQFGAVKYSGAVITSQPQVLMFNQGLVNTLIECDRAYMQLFNKGTI